MTFDEAFHSLLGHEGGYSNDPQDPGGETMWGVTVAVARASGYRGPMKSLPVEIAKGIYRRDYWDAVRANELPVEIRYAMFDAAVNSSVKQAVKWLQRAIGAADDGVIGRQTLKLAGSVHPDLILRKILGQRLQMMADTKQWPRFSRGWARRIATLLQS